MNDYLKDLGFLGALLLAAFGIYLLVLAEQNKAQHRVIQVPVTYQTPSLPSTTK